MNVEIISIFDNLSYLIHNDKQALVVDPCKGEQIADYLTDKGLELSAILNTHHHYDHIGGNNYLKNKYDCTIIAADDPRISMREKLVLDNEIIDFDFVKVKALSTSGHTDLSMSYLVYGDEEKALFTGDTIFVGGCGRVENDDYQAMWRSITKLLELDGDVKLYGGHEYALESYEFAIKMFPDYADFQIRFEELKEMNRKHGYTVPSTVAIEKQFNVFALSSNARIKEMLNMADKADWEVFKQLRQKKNVFG